MATPPKSSIIEVIQRVNGDVVSATNPLPVTASITATVDTAAHATAAAPTYVEGTDDSLSMDLAGNLRVVGTFPTAPPAKATAAAPTYTEGTNDPLSMDLSGSLRAIIMSALPAGANVIGGVKLIDTGGSNAASVSAGGALKVDGSTVTQPISAAALPLPTGASTAAKQPALGTAGAPSTDVITIQGIASGTVVPISAASLPLPAGAATSAKQPALGTAGVSSTDVITIQGIASGTVVPISAASLPLPAGAATSAKQPALGTAGVASTDVITVQGIASGVAQPISVASLPLPSGAATSALQSSVQGPVAAGTAAANSQLAGAVYNSTAPAPTTGQQMALQTDAAGRLNVNTVIDSTVTNATITSATTGATLDTTGYGSVVFQITSIGGANTIVFEGSNDNATWLPLPMLRADTTGGALVTSMTTTGAVVTAARFKFIRWRASVYASGNVTVYTALRSVQEAQPAVTVDGSAVTQPISIAAALPAGTNLLGKVGIDQTTPGTTNGVQVNAALPAGTNRIGSTQWTGTLTDRSGTIATGGASQTLMASNASRKYLLIENPTTATEPLFINFTSAASLTAAGSISLAPGGALVMEAEYVSTEAITVNATTTGHVYQAKEG